MQAYSFHRFFSPRVRARRLCGLIAVTWILLSPSAQAQTSLHVFACEPEWGALVQALVPQAKVFNATHAGQDPHHVEARPALISALRRADLAVCTGAELEVGWLPMLQQRAGNPRVMPGQPGMFYAAEGLALLPDAHHHSARDKGHVHTGGNPHLQLDPRLIAIVARRLSERIAQLDSAGASEYRQRFEVWNRDWALRIERWQQRAKPLFGQAVIAEHSSFAYLFNWLEMYQVADLEPVPGVPPTLAHLQGLVQSARADPPMAVVQTLYQDPQAGRWLGERLNRPVLHLPSTVTSQGLAVELGGLFDELLNRLLQALGARGTRP